MSTKTKTIDGILEWATFLGGVAFCISIAIGAAFLLMLRFANHLGVCR